MKHGRNVDEGNKRTKNGILMSSNRYAYNVLPTKRYTECCHCSCVILICIER